MKPITPSSLPDEELHRRYLAIANDRKYEHFVRIPGRITRCLDYFGIDCNRVAVERRLRSYYLFIGVIDNAIDSGQVEAGQIVLKRFDSRSACFDESAELSDVALMTEMLKSEISDENYPEMFGTLSELYEEVVREQTADSMLNYIERRKSVGRLTARASYLLIRPLLIEKNDTACRFMERVGAIGCLVDSVIDLRADRRMGLLNFRPTPINFIYLSLSTLRSGISLSLEHPRLLGSFFQALADNVMDRFRSSPIGIGSAHADSSPAMSLVKVRVSQS